MPEIKSRTRPLPFPRSVRLMAPVKKSTPVVIALVVIVALIGIANISSLVSGNKKDPHRRARCRCAPRLQIRNRCRASRRSSRCRRSSDADDRQRQQELAAAMQQLQAAAGVPGPEAAGTPPMTAAQREAIYGDSPNAPKQTSNVSQAQAEAKQKALGTRKAAAGRPQQRHGRHRFQRTQSSHRRGISPPTAVLAEREEARPRGFSRRLLAPMLPEGRS